MQKAIALAAKGVGRVSPEPPLGIIGIRNGRIAVRRFRANPDVDPQVGLAPCDELFLTVEPSPALAADLARHRRIVIGTEDPRWARRGSRALTRRGVTVELGVEADACRAVEPAFFHSHAYGRPYVVLKSATSLDGRIATASGESKWITGPKARGVGRRLRHRVDAILVGRGTVTADDPALTTRFEGGCDPIRIVVDSSLSISRSSQLVKTAKAVRTIVATTRSAPAAAKRSLELMGVEVWTIKQSGGRVDLRALLARMHEAGIQSLLVEGGATVAGDFVDNDLVDELQLFLAPKIVGGEGARSAVLGRGIGRLEDALHFERMSAEPIGDDLLLTAYAVRDAGVDVYGDRRRRRTGPPRGSGKRRG